MSAFPLPSELPAVSQMRCQKEALLKQHARVVWMCGLSGAGKSTLARVLDEQLTDRGYLCQVIDGDDVRSGLNKGLGFSQDDRRENLRRVAEVTRMFAGCGVITIVSFITPTKSIREMIRTIVGESDYIEVFIDASLEVCEKRDIKGLYKQAREGKISDFTGINSPFEPPDKPSVTIDTGRLSVEQCSKQLLDFIMPIVEYKI